MTLALTALRLNFRCMFSCIFAIATQQRKFPIDNKKEWKIRAATHTVWDSWMDLLRYQSVFHNSARFTGTIRRYDVKINTELSETLMVMVVYVKETRWFLLYFAFCSINIAVLPEALDELPFWRLCIKQHGHYTAYDFLPCTYIKD